MRKSQSYARPAYAGRESRLVSFLFVLFSLGIATFLALTLVAMAHGQSVSSQTSATSFILQYPQIEASQFPRIVSYVTVTDSTGATVGGLTTEHFSVREDSVREFPIIVEELTSAGEGISVLLALDRSGSMEEEMADAQNAAVSFVNLLGSNDDAALVSFSSDVRMEQTFTRDRALLRNAINAIVSQGGTAIYDAAIYCADLLQNVPGRKAVILMTDGLDKDSQTTLEQATQRYAELGIPIFVIGLGIEVSEANLRQLAQASGGSYYFSPTSKQLEEVYRAIAAVLLQSYRVTYTTHNSLTDGTQRHVRIEVNDRGANAFAYNSYLAPNSVPTIAPATQQTLSPGQDLQIQVEIPATSKYMYNLFDLQCALTYDKRYVRVKAPRNTNVVPLTFFGAATEFDFTAAVDSSKDQIFFHLKRKAGLQPVEGRGGIVQISFAALLDVPEGTNVTFNIIDLSAKDKNNWPVAVQPGRLTLQSTGMIVWPGDTNHNGAVELTDVTMLGLHWEVTGPPRPGAENQSAWMPHSAKKFDVLTATYADANGNGKIDERDLFPIGLNWRKNTTNIATPKVVVGVSTAPQGVIRLARMAGKRLQLEFENQSYAALAGLSLRMKYRGNVARFVSARATSRWGSTPLVLSNDDLATRTFAMALMIPNDAMSTASTGALVEMEVEALGELHAEDFELHEVAVISPSGELRELQVAQENLSSFTPQTFALHTARPNPLNLARKQSSSLRYDLPEDALVEVAVFNLAGQRVRVLHNGFVRAGSHTVEWQGRGEDGAALSTGTYLLKFTGRGISAKRMNATQKVLIIK